MAQKSRRSLTVSAPGPRFTVNAPLLAALYLSIPVLVILTLAEVIWRLAR